MTTYIKAGWGFDVGYDFTRAEHDTPLLVEETRGRYVYGTIAGDPNHKLGFMRRLRVRVQVDKRGIVTKGE